MAYKNCPMCTRYDYCMEDGRVCGVTEKLIEQWFDEKLEVLNETLDVCRQQSAFGNVFLMLSDSDIEALKSGKVLHWAGETFKCGIFVRYEGVKKNVQPIEENNQENKGIPLHSLLDSASRHLAKYMVGMYDEDHLRAACWNLLWALNQRVTHPELDDRFVPKMKSSNDEQFITVVCSSCGSHFEAPTEWWVRKRAQYTNIPDGVMTTCPHCGNVTIVREVKPDE